MKTIHCPRCRERLEFAGEETIQLGSAGVLTGNLSNIINGGLKVELYFCPKCGKMEFFTPIPEEPVIAKVNCSSCNKSFDADFPRCPNCGKPNPTVNK